MKITLKEFVSTLTEKPSQFLGVIRQLMPSQELYERIKELDLSLIDSRTAKARSHGLVFSDGSQLDFTQLVNRSCYRYDYTDFCVYIFEEEYYNQWEEKNMSLVCYYLIKN